VSSRSSADAEADLRSVIERLVQRFNPDLNPQLVESTVRAQAARFVGARITDFVPLLVERYSAHELSAMICTHQQQDPPAA
jgi:hypothetical protein